MKAIINFVVLFFCININIIFTTCYPYDTWNKSYSFTGISKKCNWDFSTQKVSYLTQGDPIIINNRLGHILHPDSYFGFNSVVSNLNFERLECEFNIAAPIDHGIAVSIQQMNFNKDCTDFVQLKNQDGSINKTICDKFGGFIPSYKGIEYLGELNFNKNNHDSSKWDVFDAEGRIHVKISITKKHFEKLRYLLIAFTAMKRDSSSDNKDDNEKFVLPLAFYCDGIQNYRENGDENDCDNKPMDQIIDMILKSIGVVLILWIIVEFVHDIYKAFNKNAEPEEEPSNSIAGDTPFVNFNRSGESLTFGAVEPLNAVAGNTPLVNFNRDRESLTFGVVEPSNAVAGNTPLVNFNRDRESLTFGVVEPFNAVAGDTPLVNFNRDRESLTFGAVFGADFREVSSTSIY